MTQAQHKPGCPATGGYGHGVEACECGAQPEALKRAGAVALRLACEGDERAAETIRAMNARIATLQAEKEQLLALRAGVEPVAGQCRFFPEDAWAACTVEHVRMVLTAPQDWKGYEVRYLYAASP